MLSILSSYLLTDADNRRIEEAIAPVGGGFIPAPETLEERIAQLDERIAEADILFGGRLSEEQWRKAKKLRWIHVPWAGVNTLFNVEAIRGSDILITNASGVMSGSVADQVLAYMLAFTIDLPRQLRAQERGEWLAYPLESPRRQLLRGKTLGIAGYGAIGRDIAMRARPFGMRIIATKRDTTSVPPELDRLLPSDQLHTLLASSDFVVTALPLTDATRGTIGRAEFERMKPTAYFINIARGAIVREEEMIDALRAGTIAGAALDVFEKEPLPPESPLWGLENVILTPHTAGGYQGFQAATVDLFLDNLRRYLAGEELRNVVDKGKGY